MELTTGGVVAVNIIAMCVGVGWIAYMTYIFVTSNKQRQKEAAIGTLSSDRNVQAEISVKLIYAANGRILEVGSKKPNSHAAGHYDWEYEMFIVEEGQLLSQAISSVMLLKGLET